MTALNKVPQDGKPATAGGATRRQNSTGEFWEPSAEFKAKMAQRNRAIAETSQDEFDDLWDNVPV